MVVSIEYKLSPGDTAYSVCLFPPPGLFRLHGKAKVAAAASFVARCPSSIEEGKGEEEESFFVDEEEDDEIVAVEDDDDEEDEEEDLLDVVPIADKCKG